MVRRSTLEISTHALIRSSAQFCFHCDVEICERRVRTTAKKGDARSKMYKQNRQRTFKESWKTGERGEERKWLRFDSGKNLMFCDYCITISICADSEKLHTAPFVTGADKFRLEKIKVHFKTAWVFWMSGSFCGQVKFESYYSLAGKWTF